MDFIKNLSSTITDVKDYVVEKNKRATLIAKLRATIRNEKARADKAYIALGRYYYHNLRDEMNLATEPFCTEIEEAEQRVEEANSHLDKIYNEDMIKKEASDTSAVEEPMQETQIIEAEPTNEVAQGGNVNFIMVDAADVEDNSGDLEVEDDNVEN